MKYFTAYRKAAFPGQGLINGHCFVNNYFCTIGHPVSGSGFPEGFNAADGKIGFFQGLKNYLHTLTVDSLNITVLHQSGNGPADSIAGAVINSNQIIFRGKQFAIQIISLIMGKYTQDAAKLLELVGGKENIAAVSHCMTRMRFVLNDPALANIEAIEAIPSVKGSFTQAGQFQVIIGNTVADFYNDFTAISGIEGVSKDEAKSAAKQNQNALQRIMTALAEIFAPLIPAIITGGLILGFRKVTPAVISMIVVPFCSLLLAVMAAHFVLGPIGWTIGSWISNFVYAGITGSLRLLFGAVFGFFYAPLVITGLHHMSNAIDTQLCADFGGTMLWPMIALSNIAQGSAVLGMIYLQRKNIA